MNHIKELPSHHINDSTKVNCFLDCPRKYFWEYVLNWRPDIPMHDLEFGQAWHHAQEHLLTHGYEDVDGAFIAFMNHYRQFFSEDTDLDYAPKNPINAYQALQSYVRQYVRDSKEYEVLYTEVAGSVLVAPGMTIHFRLDAILRHIETGLYRFREHKTTKSDRPSWYNQWPLAIQLGTYTYVMYCMHSPENVFGGEVNGAIFTKKGISHVRIPIKKTADTLNAWHFDIAYHLEAIQRNFDMLSKCSESDTVLEAFPRNPGSCTKYFGCPYHDFCVAWANPLQRCDVIQPGFVEFIWNPADKEKEAKKIVHI